MAQSKKTYLGKTVDVKAEHAFDINSLETYLSDTIDGFQGPITVSQFEGGQSNPTYLVSAGPVKYVLRRKPPGKLLKSAHAVDREFRVMQVLHNVGFPVARPLVLCSDEDVVGTMFYVMEFVSGRVFWDPIMPDVAPHDRTEIFYSLVDTLAKLHDVDWKSHGLQDYGREGNYFDRQVSRWSKQYRLSETEKIEEMDKVIEWLPSAMPDDESSCLIHGDYGLHNVVVNTSSPEVIAVLDWELSTIGHPLSDFIYCMMPWYRPDIPDGRSPFPPDRLKELGIPAFEDLVTRYCKKTGRSSIENVGFYRAFNLFRAAAIGQGIAARAKQGTAAGSDAAELAAAAVRPLAKAAWHEAQQAGAV